MMICMSSVRLAFQALGDPVRFTIFECIRRCGGTASYHLTTSETNGIDKAKGITACELGCMIPCSPSSLSRHIGVLREVGLVSSVRVGRKLFVQVLPEMLNLMGEYCAPLTQVSEELETSK